MPCLGERMSYNAGLIVMAYWVVRRPHLKRYDGAPPPMNHIEINMYIGHTRVQLIGRWQLTLKWNLKWCCRRNLDNMILEERMIKCRLFSDVHTVYDISIWALWISQNQWLQEDTVTDFNRPYDPLLSITLIILNLTKYFSKHASYPPKQCTTILS